MTAPDLPAVLLSGFEPFGGDDRNPSWEVADQLDGEPVPDDLGRPVARVRSLRLPCVFGEAFDVRDAGIRRHDPVDVVALGLDASRTDIAPRGSSRAAVRGLSASKRASTSRLNPIAALRAATMQTTTQPTCAHANGCSRHASSAPVNANGSAKTEWLKRTKER